jgi:transposase
VTGFVVEHRLHALSCQRCNHTTRAELPAAVPKGAFGPRLQAVMALFSGAYRLGKRTVATAMGDLFGVDISVGSVSASEELMSEALAAPVAQARDYVQKQPVVHGDETGWRENRKRAWLWVAASSMVTVFLVHARRGAKAARELLGEFAGILVTDRWHAYSQWALKRRQLCFAHLRRDFQFIAERGKSAGRIGLELVALTKQMFRAWRRVRDGTLSRRGFRMKIAPIRARMEMLLKNGVFAAHEE